jgi:hypothetical protein
MAFSYSPKIITDGLVLYLDAANTRSYPGSGTTWSDLSRNQNNGTLVNGPTFNSANGGSIVFDGSNDFVDLSTLGNPITSNNFTFNFWSLPTQTHQIDSESTTGVAGTSGQKYAIDVLNGITNSYAGVSVGTNGISVYEHGSAYMPALLVYQTTITTYTNIAVVYVAKQPLLYINGVLVRTGLTSPKTQVFLGIRWIGKGDYGFYGGQLSSIGYYNRALSATEVLQNYNATKTRFGL